VSTINTIYSLLGYDAVYTDATEMWRGRCFRCSPLSTYYYIPLSPTLARVIKRKAIVVGEGYIHQHSYQQNGWVWVGI